MIQKLKIKITDKNRNTIKFKNNGDYLSIIGNLDDLTFSKIINKLPNKNGLLKIVDLHSTPFLILRDMVFFLSLSKDNTTNICSVMMEYFDFRNNNNLKSEMHEDIMEMYEEFIITDITEKMFNDYYNIIKNELLDLMFHVEH